MLPPAGTQTDQKRNGSGFANFGPNKIRLGIRKKQWAIHPADAHSAQLAKSLKVSAILAQVLINRGINDTQAGSAFLSPRLTELISPEKMPGAENAAERIKQAIKDKKKITIYGDYDVDGIAGVSILFAILRLLDADVDYYIPHRIEEGYGLNAEAVEALSKSGTEVLITVDCGITAFKSAKLVEKLGLDLIITDHHQAEKKLPKAVAIVHPALDQSYVNQSSCGAMVAFKLAWLLANRFKTGKKLEPGLREFMLNATSLASMGTVADVMDLTGENRVLTSYGLKALPECKLCGIEALIESTGLTGYGLDSFHIGFRLGPMLNAAGRMGHARLAVELLTSDSQIRAMQIAEYLKEQNNQRKRYERKIFKQACEMIVQQGLNHPDRKSIVLASDQWHTGVIGIVAARIVDKFYRPTIMINQTKQISQGSARSITGFDILGGISACSQHLTTFGGHKMAAGITLETEKINTFAAEFETYAKENLNEEDVTDKLLIDAETDLGEFTKALVTELRMLGPFGQGNPEPVFATKGVHLASSPRTCGANGTHLQLAVTDNTAALRCIGFGMGKLEKKLLEHEFFNVAYQPKINTYNGASNVELVLADVQFE
ncbi:MAG: single-stranded-DNA-specific exonuclease RecJ [Planctomycetota bacterium]|jgi:single-stranded-DNA-specific exonuclease